MWRPRPRRPRRPHRPRRLHRAGSPGVAAPDPDVAGRWGALRAEAALRLHALARWCEGAKLFACREEVYEGLLRLDADDAVARKWLRYARSADGRWTRDPSYRRPRNLERGEKDFLARRAEVGAWFAATAAPVLSDAKAAGEFRVRAEVVSVGLGVDPESVVLRGWNEEVRDEGARAKGGKAPPWILLETLRARDRRPALRRAAAEAVEAVPAPAPGTLEEADRRGNVEWPSVFQSEHARVLGVPPVEEMVRTVRHVEAAWPLFREAFGRQPGTPADEARYGRGLCLYVFDSPVAAALFLEAQPEVTPRFLEFVAPLVATWIPKRAAVVVKATIPEIRLEAAPRQVLGWMVAGMFGLDRRRAWISEGLLIYLTWQITGTRRLSSANDVEQRYAEGDRPIPEYQARLAEDGADWYALGRLLLESPDKPDPFLMLGKDFNQLTKLEVLYAWCIAAWLVEGRPSQAATVFTALGGEGGNDLDAVGLEQLGFDARTLEERVHRWLVETADVPAR